MSKTIQKIWNCVAWTVVAAAVLLAILLAGVRLFGFQVYTVLSGSMEPEYHTGSLIYVREVDTAALQAGDVITFMLDKNTIATHRVVGIVWDENDPTVYRFRTKGDANDTEDGTLVHYRNIIGSPVFTIPYLGYVASFIQNPPGTYIAISIGAILVLFVFLPDLLFGESGEEKKKRSCGEEKDVAEHPVKAEEERRQELRAWYESLPAEKQAQVRRQLAEHRAKLQEKNQKNSS